MGAGLETEHHSGSTARAHKHGPHLAGQARPAADVNRTEIEALLASGQTALQAASTAAEQDRLTNDLDAWKNLLLDAAVSRDTTH